MRPTRRAVLAAGLGAVACRRRRSGAGRVDELVRLIRASSQKDVLKDTAQAIRSGASEHELLEAAFVAALTGIADFDVHVLLVVPSIYWHVPGRLPAMWCVANAQSWPQEQVRRPPPRGTEADLARAFGLGDPDAAESAAAALRDPMPLLRLEATRQRADPHAAIYAAQATRMLAVLDGRYTEPVARSLARYLARTGPPAPEPATLALDPADRTDPVEIARALAGGQPVAGVSPGGLWEALAVLALGTRVADGAPSSIGVHQTTVLDALWFLHDAAPRAERPRILARAVPAVLGVQNPVAAPVPPRVPEENAKLTSARARAQADVSGFVSATRREVELKGDTEHDFKYFGAVEAVAEKLSPGFRPSWWAGTAFAHPIGSVYRWDRAEEAERCLAP